MAGSRREKIANLAKFSRTRIAFVYSICRMFYSYFHKINLIIIFSSILDQKPNHQCVHQIVIIVRAYFNMYTLLFIEHMYRTKEIYTILLILLLITHPVTWKYFSGIFVVVFRWFFVCVFVFVCVFFVCFVCLFFFLS